MSVVLLPSFRAVFQTSRLAAVRLAAVSLCLALGLGGCGGGHSAGVSSAGGGLDGATFPPGLRAHDFTLQNQRGRRVSLSAYRGQVVVLAFLFSDCRTCVLVAQQVRGALDELQSATPTSAAGISPNALPGMHTIFVSTDPSADTPMNVSRFLEETSLSGRVEYLTGTTGQLQPVWHAYGVPPVSDGKANSEAGIAVLLIDRKGIERDGFGVEQITAESLAHDIRLLGAG